MNTDNRAGLVGIAGLKLLDDLEKAFSAISAFTFPALIEYEKPVNDVDHDEDECDGDDCEGHETQRSLKCPWCDEDVTGSEALYNVDYSERWSYSRTLDSDDRTRRKVWFYTGDDDYGDDLYLVHEECDRPVSMPASWEKDWNY